MLFNLLVGERLGSQDPEGYTLPGITEKEISSVEVQFEKNVESLRGDVNTLSDVNKEMSQFPVRGSVPGYLPVTKALHTQNKPFVLYH